MNKIVLKDIDVIDGSVKYFYNIEGEWKKYYNDNLNYEIEYPINVSNVPKNVLAVPFVCNILPIVWLCDATLQLETIDKDFFENITHIKKGYEEMYPMLSFNGDIKVDNVEENRSKQCDKSAVFFSGGVDAYTTLLRHLNEKPCLVTIWGADVKVDDIQGWKNVESHISTVSEEYGLGFYAIKSNFRLMIKENRLDELVRSSLEGWWHGFQHGIAMIGHMAPLAFELGIERAYIASSFPEKMKGQYTCASDPTIDNYVSYCGAHTIHDGYELDRQEKIQYLVEKKNQGCPIKLRVCWMSKDGKNCCECEKCYRTILEIVSEGGAPEEFGFTWDDKAIKICKKNMLNKITVQEFCINQFYYPIIDRLKSNIDKIENYEKYKWLLDIDYSRFNEYPMKKFYNSLMGRAICKIQRILKKR